MPDLADTITNKCREVVGYTDKFVPLHSPTFTGAEWTYVKECLDTGWVSSAGNFVDRFEKNLASFCGVKHTVAVCNGTAALHTCLIVSGVSRNDEVIIPTLTFVATANAVTYVGAVPHFADIEPETLGINPLTLYDYLDNISEIRNGQCFNIQTGRRIAALIPMHTFGHPAKIDELIEISQNFGITLIEDAAESLGSYYKGKHTGSFGRIGAVSFNGNKIITTGGGGALLTNDNNLAKAAKHITTTAKRPHPWHYDHDAIGYNYRMPNLNAALGVAQLEQLPSFIKHKRAVAKHYATVFQNVEGLSFVTEPKHSKSNYWLCTLLLDAGQEDKLETILKLSNEKGIMTRPAWTPMHQLPAFKNCPRMNLTVSENMAKRLLNIPSSANIVKSTY